MSITKEDLRNEISTFPIIRLPKRGNVETEIPQQQEAKSKGISVEITWCPGCTNFAILEAVKRAISKLIEEGIGQKDFAMVAGIGCHAKIFDYLNISGIYGLHGRVLPTALGIKLGNPNLNVLGFSGDGDAYAEGMEHFIHSFRHNPDITYIVHDNHAFSLTLGQPTPTSQQGYENKFRVVESSSRAINPIKLAIAAGATFVARCNAIKIEHTAQILKKAIKHRGFSYIEVMQSCPIFNPLNELAQLSYEIEDNTDAKKALEIADEWDYYLRKGKIPLGIIYKNQSIPIFEDKYPLLKELKERKIGWNELNK